jgi:hypothetical protein
MLNIATGPLDFLSDMVAYPADVSLDEPGAGGWWSQVLYVGGSVYSPSGAFRLNLQADGDLVVQVIDDATLPPQWTTGQVLDPKADVQWVTIYSFGTSIPSGPPDFVGNVELDMQTDGNLVVYAGPSNGMGVVRGSPAIFASGTNNNPGAFLRMQDDGNLVVYSVDGVALWATGTNART